VARAIGLAERTLRSWVAAADQQARRRGRPRRGVGAGERRVLEAAVVLERGQVSVATLRRWCPHASRRALQQWLRSCRASQRRDLQRLAWTQPGRVWAMDFSEAPRRIDGDYRYVLHVRDLASGAYLAALPTRRATTTVTCDALRAVCAAAPAPLVLKVDNGSAFRSHDLRAWADRMGTHILHSPPRCPRYNGGIEASIGALTTRAHHAAAAAGHPEYWTCDDVEAARAAANAHVRRRPTRITRAERQRFRRAYAQRARARRDRQGAVSARDALVHTLIELGYMCRERKAS